MGILPKEKYQRLLKIIPQEEGLIREVLEDTLYPRESLIDFIGRPTVDWHWKSLEIITGKSYDELKKEMDPED